MPRPLDYSEIDKEPDYEAALAAYVAAHPESPDAQAQRALPSGGAPPPMTSPVAALRSMTVGATPNRRITGPTLTLGPGGSVGTYDVRGEDDPPEPTPEGEAMFADLQKAGRASQGPPDVPDEALPDVSMPLPPDPKPATPLGKTVQVGHAAQVDVPNTAISRSALSAPIAPGEGRAAAPPSTPAAALQEDPTTAALKAVVAGARPAQAPQGDVDLEAALRAASGRQFVASMARAGGAMIGRGQGAGYDALDRDADRPVAEFQARRALSEQDRQHAALQAAADAARGKERFSEEMARGELDVKRGELAVHQRAEAAKERKGASGGGNEKELDKESATLEHAWDPSAARAGERGKNQARINAAGRINRLALGADGKVLDLNPQQMKELARQLDTLLSNGGQATEGITNALSAHTASGKVAELEQWLTSEPHGAGQRAFVQQMVETARREKDEAGAQLRDSYIETLPGVPNLLKHRRPMLENMLRARGVDPSTIDFETGLARPDVAAPVAGPRRIASDSEYDALPSGAEFIGPDGKHRRKP